MEGKNEIVFKKILLVGLSMFGKRWSFTPLDLAYSIGYLRKVEPRIRANFTQLALHQGRGSLHTVSKELQKAKKKIIKEDPDLVVFFLENILLSGMFYEGIFLRLAKILKKEWQGKVVFQSHKLDNAKAKIILKLNPVVDFVILGEPELPLLELILGRSKGKIIKLKPGNLMPLKEIPSPYLSGILDLFLRKKGVMIMLETKRGCPGSCHYCFRSVKHSSVRFFNLERVMEELRYLKTKGREKVFIIDDLFIFNLLYLKRFVSLYKKFFKNQNGPWLVITSRLENLTLEAIDLLDLIKVSLIQIGLQSTNPKTFKFFGRKLGRTEIKKKYKAIKKKCGSEILIDLILGLPQDNLQKFKESLDFTIKLKPQRIQIKQLYLNPGTRFYKEQKKYNFQVNQKRDDFRSPFVLENCSFKEKEMKEAFLYIKKVAKREKKIHWKVLTAWGNFRS